MLGWLRRRGVRAVERQLEVELPHLWEMERVAPGMLGTLALTLPAVGYRKRAPRDVINLVRIGATLAQDCGDCLQIAVNVARQEGVPVRVVEAAVRGWAKELTHLQARARRYGERVAAGLDAEEDRRALAEALGEPVVMELALAVATAQLFPVLRRGLGLSHACRLDLIRYAAS